ncbi:kinase-like domain-containing protein [Gymnopilus junonius]|uniref:Kinase-like domain-containing protein n=1 Tax=Gymnopilus junonius TaxID=109634 RepID=A0A9P5TL75_GYMJU|nr:kinase-like domain-containing protein [Gymnopilus junonius]
MYQQQNDNSFPELPPFDPEEPARTTHTLSSSRRRLNQYIRGEKIGKGKHGEVYACRTEDANAYTMASQIFFYHAVKAVLKFQAHDKMKLLRRNYQQQSQNGRLPLNSTVNSIRKEIAIMKKCRHGNVVRLIEVIDDPQDEKIYMIMELLPGGEVQWKNAANQPILMLRQVRRILRDTILGLEYLHQEGIIHRDIKPANILYTRDRRSVKIIDFGVAHYTPPSPKSKQAKGKQVEQQNLRSDPYSIDPSLFPKSDLRKRVGTPSFLAPEVVWVSPDGPDVSPSPSVDYLSPSLTNVSPDQTSTTFSTPAPRQRPPITKAIDVWSLGVTFYCLLFGHTPFSAPTENGQSSEFVLYNKVLSTDWNADDFMGTERVPTGGRHPPVSDAEGYAVIQLLDHMLQKNPKHRIDLPELKAHPWVLRDIDNPREWLQLTSPSDDNQTKSNPNWVKNASKKILKLIPGTR